ncbi:Lysine-specific demethylase JMJ25 [Linum perenne]
MSNSAIILECSVICTTVIFDYHRSCSRCESNICLVCCHEIRDDNLRGNGGIRCPCGSGILELRTLCNWVSQLVKRAEGLTVVSVAPSANKCACFNLNGDRGIQCDKLMKASSCNQSDDNYLFYPKAKDLTEEDFQHFSHHWKKGEPVIVGNVLETGSGISWDPEVMWRAFRQIKSKKHDTLMDVKTLNCLDWCEEKVSLRKFFNAYSKGEFNIMGWPRMLKLKEGEFRQRLPRHAVEYSCCLPLKEYTHPEGPRNLASKLPSNSRNSNMGPKAHIAYGFPHELGRGDSTILLFQVNVLAHTQEINYNSTMLSTIETLKEQHFEEDKTELFGTGELTDGVDDKDCDINEVDSNQIGDEGGALWFWMVQVVDPIHDQTFYLTEKHKRKLKKEYGIEPWTFVQKLGDAVFIPAGCPYQVRNLKSCINVASNFVSPESIGACIRLTDEFRLLPLNHPAKEDKLQVKKMCLHAVDIALSIVMNKSQVRDDEEQGFNGEGKSGIKLEEESTET